MAAINPRDNDAIVGSRGVPSISIRALYCNSSVGISFFYFAAGRKLGLSVSYMGTGIHEYPTRSFAICP